MIKVGVIGAGHLGKIHLKIINSSNQNLIGFYDTDETNSKKHYIFDLFRTDLSDININLN